MRPCGACMYNCVLDAKVPYGLDPMHLAITVEIEVECLELTILAV